MSMLLNGLTGAQAAQAALNATSQNVAKARSEGIEASLTLRPAEKVEAIISFTHTDTRNLATGGALLRRPRERRTRPVSP